MTDEDKLIAEVHEEEIKKIFLFVRGPLDNAISWAELWTQRQAEDYVKHDLAKAGVLGKPFESYRVERHREESEVSILIWGEDSPSVQLDDYGDKKGLLVKLDGKEVFSNLRPIEDDEEVE
jgi:hypothetical protein